MQLKIFQKGFNYSQDGSGNRLVYHLQGCNLTCPWCANPEGMDTESEAMFTMSLDEIQDEAMRCRPMFFDNGGVTFTGGEATCQFMALKEILTRLHSMGISTSIETNGTAPGLAELFPVVDELIMDFKHYNSQKHKALMGMGNEIIKMNLAKAFEMHRNLLVRIPLIGGVNAADEDMEQFVLFFLNYDVSKARFELLAYHEYGKEKWRRCKKAYTVKDAFVSDETKTKYEEYMRQKGLRVVRT